MKPDTYIVKDMDTLRIMADSLRAQILELLIPEPLNARQVAAKLGVQTSKIYYHLGLLEKHGLIEVVETTLIGNLIEKIYRAVAEDFDIDPGLINFRTGQGKDNLTSIVDTTMDAVRIDLRRSLDARLKELENGAPEEQRTIMITRSMAALTDQQAQEFFARLQLLMKEFKDINQDPSESQKRQVFSLTLVFNPTFYFPEEVSENLQDMNTLEEK